MPRPGYFKQLWYNWKALDLPWRKKWLRGVDLAGNTFWEFKDSYGAQRLRRIVQYSRRIHYGDVKLTPQWIQWLRHTRADPPTVAEQQLDEARQLRMKQLAAAADARWAAKPSALDPPTRNQPDLPLTPRDEASPTPNTEPVKQETEHNVAASPAEVEAESEGRNDVEESQPIGPSKEFKTEKAPSSWPKTKKPKEFKKEKAPATWQEPKTSQEWQPDSWKPKVARRR